MFLVFLDGDGAGQKWDLLLSEVDSSVELMGAYWEGKMPEE